MTPLGLTNREAWTLMGLSRSQFYRLKKLGVLDPLKSPIPRRWSRERIERWMAGDRLPSRFLRSA